MDMHASYRFVCISIINTFKNRTINLHIKIHIYTYVCVYIYMYVYTVNMRFYLRSLHFSAMIFENHHILLQDDYTYILKLMDSPHLSDP